MSIVLASVLALHPVPQEPTVQPSLHSLSVLYAGELGTPREQSFVAFLTARFTKVGKIAATDLIASKAEGYDVVVADGTTEMKDKRVSMSGCTRLDFPPEWTKPTILIASAGKSVEKTTKIGWL